MAALDFPSASSSPFVAPNGVIYTYIGTSPNGYWEANTANASQNLTNLFVVKTGSTMSGALKLDNAANASNPDLAFDSDSNTGIYSPAANTLGITTAGTQRFTVDSSGNVLVGKTASSGVNAGCEFRSNGIGLFTRASANPVQVRRLTDDGDLVEFYQDAGLIGSIGVQGTSLTVGMAGPEKLRIDSSGKVGIGCIPVRDLQLHTSDSSSELMLSNSTTGATAGSGFMIQLDGNDTYIWNKENSFMSFGTNALERMRIDSSGKLVVGATSFLSGANSFTQAMISGTDGGLIINSTNTSASSYCRLMFTPNGHITGNEGMVRYNTNDYHMAFWTQGNERMRIDSTGNVGIGTSSPATTLHLSTTGADGLRLGVDSQSYYHMLRPNGDGLYIGADDGNTGGNGADIRFNVKASEKMRIDSSGNVGIGESNPDTKLDVNGAFFLRPTTQSFPAENGVGMRIRSDTNRFQIQALQYTPSIVYYDIDYFGLRHLWHVNGSERMRISSAGRLGLGTSAPTHSLHVVGDYFRFDSSNAALGTIYIGAETNVNSIYSQDSAGNAEDFRFMSGSSEYARITGNGYFHASPGGSYFGNVNPGFHSFDQQSTAQWTLGARSSHPSPFGLLITFSGGSPNNNTNQFIYASDSTRLRFGVKSNGGIENFSGNNSNLCDEREKKNIVSLETKWDKVKNWELRKFHYNEDADTDDLRYGVIAQEVEIENPELITDFTKQRAEDAVLDEDGTVVTPAKEEILRKGVKEQQMMWMSIKALQEAMAKIETLEAKVAALEAD